ncbi:EboA domain-containing protein [Chitinophaga caeni]|uniref:EboA domain-containing protein n=1 Tax=Chitinophaga caeni TaxID=2029983 RepID=UPI0018E09D9A|nr:EboA domain-containing protein [Chitinophaga caeni]
MEYLYDVDTAKSLLLEIIKLNSDEKSLVWLHEKLTRYKENPQLQIFNTTFTAIPRFIGKANISNYLDNDHFERIIPGCYYSYTLFTTDQLARLWWLMQIQVNSKEAYCKAIEQLFLSAEMRELVALYKFLPYYAYPEYWVHQTKEGIRSNIGYVLAAIMEHNPYPAKYLDEAAWNQLVLKAFFTEMKVSAINGLMERANPTLARILWDYANERRSAGRRVPNGLWNLVGPFADTIDWQKLTAFYDGSPGEEKKEMALGLSLSPSGPIKEWLDATGFGEDIKSGKIKLEPGWTAHPPSKFNNI